MAREIAPGLHWIQACGSDRHLELAFEGFPPASVAPIHGHPIMGDDVEGVTDRLIAAAKCIAGANSLAE